MDSTSSYGVPYTAWRTSVLGLLLLVLTLITAVIGIPSGEARPWERYLKDVQPSSTPDEQAEAVEGLLQRLLQDRAEDFAVIVDTTAGPQGKDTFIVKSPGVTVSVEVTGSSGVAAAWGILHYLKYYCHAHVSWEAQQLDLPDTLPPASFNITSNDKFRYYQNVCTVSYSMAWWGWQRWQKEIDWMALNGINLPLAFTGQEAIWQRLYTKMGLTQEELDEHFAGPAFLAWGRMGNIRGWGGPLWPSWHNQTLILQKQILARMRQFGMIPVLPAFAGHVPAGIARIYPEANITRLGPWSHFTDPYTRTYLLDFNDPLFQEIGSAFIEEVTSEFGSDHIYNCDTFNEMTPASSDPEYLRSVGVAVYSAISKADPDAIWVMQGWLFYSDQSFWRTAQAEALLTSVPTGRLLVLDLASEVAPQYSRLQSYFGQPFIFCMLHNFGGVDGLFGNVDVLLKNYEDARNFPNVTMVGTGLTPEGINQNYVMYDFMNELGWRPAAPQVSSWAADYASRRYGSNDGRLGQAWNLLMRSVYNNTVNTVNHGQYVIVKRPKLNLQPDKLWYSVSDVVAAWDLLVSVVQDKNQGLNIESQQIYQEYGANQSPPSPLRKKTIANKKITKQEILHKSIRLFKRSTVDGDVEAGDDDASGGEKMKLDTLSQLLQRTEAANFKEREVSEGEVDWRLIGDNMAVLVEHEDDDEEGENHKYVNNEYEQHKLERKIKLENSNYMQDEGLFAGSVEEEDDVRSRKEKINTEGVMETRYKSVTDQATFQHDLVDVTRQILQVVGGEMALTLITNYNNQVLLALQESHHLLQVILTDLDLLLGSSPDFLLGRWLEDAASWATNEKERDQYIFNALNQISLWGPTGEIHDYAIKQWSGLITNYIKPRWEFFSETLETSLEQGKPFNEEQFNWDLFTLVEDPFTKETNVTYPTDPQGNTTEIVVGLYNKYRPVFDSRLLQVMEKRYQKHLRAFSKTAMKRKRKIIKRKRGRQHIVTAAEN
ncbi:hypothetical protein OTU49_002998, partial [Cherax quadricarinatus]